MRVRCPNCGQVTKVEEDLLDYLARCDHCYSFLRLRPAAAKGPGPQRFRVSAFPRSIMVLTDRVPSGIFDFPVPPVDVRPVASAKSASRLRFGAWRGRSLWLFSLTSIFLTLMLMLLGMATLLLHSKYMMAMPRTAGAASMAPINQAENAPR